MMTPRGISRRKSTTTKFSRRQLAKNPELAKKLHQLTLGLSPLVQLNTGHVHPDFPKTILHFWLLTEDQLEDLAHFYHQRTPSVFSSRYPCPINWRSDATVDEKRFQMGRFIGLITCDPPVSLKSEEQIAQEARIASRDEAAWRRKMNPFM